VLLPERTLPAPAVLPPTVLSVALPSSQTPRPLASAAVPAAPVPMKLPPTWLRTVPGDRMLMPARPLPPMTLP
jgi:hypothetical protein